MMSFILCILCANLTISHGEPSEGDSLFFVFLNTNPDRPVLADSLVKKLQEGHMANIGRLHNAGKLVAAGPFAGGGGLFIMKTGTEQETWDSLKTDPAISAGRFMLEVYPLHWLHGGNCQPPEGSAMTGYASARVRWGESGPQNTPDSTLAVIDFSGQHQGFVVFATEDEKLAREILERILPDDASFTVRKLWIARGTFCEE